MISKIRLNFLDFPGDMNSIFSVMERDRKLS